MKLIRTWPAKIPEGRTGYVVDQIPHVALTNYDMRQVINTGDDILCIEWDLALDKADLITFMEHIDEDPKRVIVAPYKHYPEANPGMDHAQWAHRRFLVDDPPRTAPVRYESCPPVQDDDPFCHIFGFGMVYLPHEELRRFAEDYLVNNPNGQLNDQEFAEWHYRTSDNYEVPICWDVRPVHLHYSTKGLVS